MSINPVHAGSDAPVGEYNAEAVATAIRDLLIAIGEDPDREGLARYARSSGSQLCRDLRRARTNRR
jgi:GTP cyclohydrolase I